MVASEAAAAILGTLLQWLEVALVIGIIYQIINMFTGGNLGDLFGGGDGGSNDNRGNRDNRRDRNGNNVNDGQTDDGNDKAKKPKGLDNENPGLVRVYVTDIDTNPIEGATVTIRALDMPLWRRATGRHGRDYVVYRNKTGANGLCPPRTNLRIGSGPVRVVVRSKYGNNDHDDVIHPAGEEAQVIHVTIDRRGNNRQAFEPYIDNVRDRDGWLELDGRVE